MTNIASNIGKSAAGTIVRFIGLSASLANLVFTFSPTMPIT
jgi:hypothetical protein